MHPVVLACRRLRSRTRRAGRANGGGCISCTLRTKENVEYQTLGWCAWEVVRRTASYLRTRSLLIDTRFRARRRCCRAIDLTPQSLSLNHPLSYSLPSRFHMLLEPCAPQ